MATAQPPKRRRSRPLRIESNDRPFFVSSRILEERYWLHPILSCGVEPPNRAGRRLDERLRRHADRRLATAVKRANALRRPNTPELTLEVARILARDQIGAALARAQERYGVQVYAFVVMSNHFHLLCQTRHKNLAKFMGYAKARMTDSINLLTGKRGPLWARRYDAEPVVDDEGCADRMGYTANNPRAAGLVDDAHDWPGLNLTFGCSERSELTFTYLDRTAWHRARRPADLRPFLKQTTLTLSPIPACEGMPPEFYRQSLQTWMQHSHDKTVAKNRDAATKRNPTAPQAREDRPVLGLAAIVQTPFEARPRAPSLRRRPYAHGRPDRVRAHIHATLLIVHDYDDRSQRYREGDFSVEFPEGTYRPPLMRAA